MITRKNWFPKDLDKETKIVEQSSRDSVPEEQLFKVKQIEDGSEYFHDILKGCELDDIEIGYRGSLGKKSQLTIQFCKTHNCRCHKDGWQIGHWMGQDSKKLDNRKLSPEIPRQ